MVTDRGEALDTQAQSRIIAQLAEELGARPVQISAAVELLDDGATVPFIARYRKEVTGGLDDTVLRNLEVRLEYLRDMETRRAAILSSIDQQGKLTPELKDALTTADTKQRLEDLYAPYKPKRRPAPRSPGKRAWSPWPTPFSPIRPSIRKPPPPPTSTPRPAWPTPRPPWTAPATS